jgi:hypothetical protein
MLTIGCNLDRPGQTLTYLPYFDSFQTFFTLIILNYFLLKIKEDFIPWNPIPKLSLSNRRPNHRNKKTIFVGIYGLECLFL